MNFNATANAYKDDRYSFILKTEESGNPHLTPYNDGNGWVTIGIGFNLSDDNVRSQVFAKMGITNVDLINNLTNYLKDPQRGASNSDIQEELDRYMNQYTPGGAFQFPSENPIKELFNGPNGNDGLVQTYEQRVTDWANNNGLGLIPQSKERLVLVSLSYNGVLGSNLATAIKNNNRAEAWFEIGYDSNKLGNKVASGAVLMTMEQNDVDNNKDIGVAKRRYYEAELFGLYDNPANISDAEYKSVLQMYTRHR